GALDADQPVLLGQGKAVNGARAVMLVGALAVDPQEAQAMERVWLLFDAGDEGQLQAARAEWKAVTAAGLAAQYWNDESGRWEKKAEAG
ncbi:MAG: DNA polymerase III subunit chi, partial [Paracoccaceae bacterium]